VHRTGTLAGRRNECLASALVPDCVYMERCDGVLVEAAEEEAPCGTAAALLGRDEARSAGAAGTIAAVGRQATLEWEPAGRHFVGLRHMDCG
jgi:hypothetical protein